MTGVQTCALPISFSSIADAVRALATPLHLPIALCAKSSLQQSRRGSQPEGILWLEVCLSQPRAGWDAGQVTLLEQPPASDWWGLVDQYPSCHSAVCFQEDTISQGSPVGGGVLVNRLWWWREEAEKAQMVPPATKSSPLPCQLGERERGMALRIPLWQYRQLRPPYRDRAEWPCTGDQHHR